MNHAQVHERAFEIFNKSLINKITALQENKDLKLVHYTSASVAISIIKNKNVWLRNTQCMNDFLEVRHGLKCLSAAWNLPKAEPLRDFINKIFGASFKDKFNSWIPLIETESYITCISEHPLEEDKFGRLSMWRAYGGDSSVGLILNKDAFENASDDIKLQTWPVNYFDDKEFEEDFLRLVDRVVQNEHFLKENLTSVEIESYLFETFVRYAVSTKHKGFSEEREWRVIYSPMLNSSDHIKLDIETVNSIPQKVYKAPLKEIPEIGYVGTGVQSILEKIIVGPNEHGGLIQDALIQVLKDEGFETPESMVTCSNVPLRR